MQKKKNNDFRIARERLESALCEYSRCLLESRLEEEKLPITESALQNAGEIYSEKLMGTIEICASNLVETDISNLKGIFEKIDN